MCHGSFARPSLPVDEALKAAGTPVCSYLKGERVSMRRACAAAVVILLAMLSSAPANAARNEVEPESTRTYNDGEQGYLALTIPVTLTSETGAEIPGKIAGECEFATTGIPNTSETVVTVFAHAISTATSAGYPVATSVHCVVSNAHGGVDLDRAAPLTTVAQPGASRVRYGVFTICLRVSALYDTNDSVASTQVCTRP